MSRRNAPRWKATALLFCAAPGLIAAGPDLATQASNLSDQRAAVSRFLDDLAGERPAGDGISLRERMARMAAHPPPSMCKEDFERAGKRPYAANQVLGSMGLIAAIAAATVGSAQQGVQADLLKQYAGMLSGNSDPRLQQASAIMSQESQAVSAGDSTGATALAQAFAGIATEAVPAGYQPSAADMALGASLKAVDSYDWASTFMALGQAVMAGLLGALQGGIYGAIVGVAVSLVTSAIQGDFTAQNSTLEGQGTNANSTGESAGVSGAQALAGIIGANTGGSGQGASSGSAGLNGSVLTVASGASGQVLQPGKGSAAGGTLVGSEQSP
jgi:hypothetical protein